MLKQDDMGADVDTAVSALSRGELVILPTETVYGLACDAGDPHAAAFTGTGLEIKPPW